MIEVQYTDDTVASDGTVVLPVEQPQQGIQNLYIVRVIMSSGHNTVESHDVDIKGFTREITYKFDAETRKKIAAIRMKHKQPLYNNSVDFHGLWICREDQIMPIMAAVRAANKELQVINTLLGAESEFIPLSTSDIRKGELAERIIDAIKYRIFKDVFDRLREVMENKSYQQKGELTDRTRESLNNLCDQLHQINLLDDKDIEQRIESIRKSIESNSIAPLRDELDKAIQGLQVKSRWTALSLT